MGKDKSKEISRSTMFKNYKNGQSEVVSEGPKMRINPATLWDEEIYNPVEENREDASRSTIVKNVLTGNVLEKNM